MNELTIETQPEEAGGRHVQAHQFMPSGVAQHYNCKSMTTSVLALVFWFMSASTSAFAIHPAQAAKSDLQASQSQAHPSSR